MKSALAKNGTTPCAQSWFLGPRTTLRMSLQALLVGLEKLRTKYAELTGASITYLCRVILSCETHATIMTVGVRQSRITPPSGLIWSPRNNRTSLLLDVCHR